MIAPGTTGTQAPSDHELIAAAFHKADAICPFGPSFFLGHLARFVRDQCPDPGERLPVVRLFLTDGEVLDLCHIIGIASRWVMLAVRDPGGPHDRMSVDLVPFELIRRVQISIQPAEGASIGFAQAHPPAVITPESLVRDAMTPPSVGASPTGPSATPVP